MLALWRTTLGHENTGSLDLQLMEECVTGIAQSTNDLRFTRNRRRLLAAPVAAAALLTLGMHQDKALASKARQKNRRRQQSEELATLQARLEAMTTDITHMNLELFQLAGEIGKLQTLGQTIADTAGFETIGNALLDVADRTNDIRDRLVEERASALSH